MLIRMYAWPVKDSLYVALASVDLDERGRELALALGSDRVPCPRAVRNSRVDLAWLATRTAHEIVTPGSPHLLGSRTFTGEA